MRWLLPIKRSDIVEYVVPISSDRPCGRQAASAAVSDLPASPAGRASCVPYGGGLWRRLTVTHGHSGHVDLRSRRYRSGTTRMVRMGSPVRFRRGAPPQTSSPGRIHHPACCIGRDVLSGPACHLRAIAPLIRPDSGVSASRVVLSDSRGRGDVALVGSWPTAGFHHWAVGRPCSLSLVGGY
jgi:hypothetical protein